MRFGEDDPMNRKVVRGMLRGAGAEMDEASDAATGLRMIDNASFNIWPTKPRMPGTAAMLLKPVGDRTVAQRDRPHVRAETK